MTQGTSAEWRPRIERGKKPLYLAIADAIASDVHNGRLAPGARLPTQRELASIVGADLTTITRAYKEATRRGLVTARVGQGSFVAAAAASQTFGASGGAPIDLTMNMPPLFDDAKLARRLWGAFAEVERREGLSLLMRYQDPGGAQEDRSVGAEWLGQRVPNLAAERTMISAGTQAAIVAVLAVLANAGDAICTEAMAYPGLRAAAAHLGLEVVGLELDGEGIIPAAFARACRDVGVKALCCTPTLQNPTTATMSVARREEIIAVARRYRVPIVEDDAYGRLPEPAPPPLAALAPDLSWHIAGLAKLASPALRIAYVAAPDAQGAIQVAAQLRALNGMASPVTAAAASHWISTGLASALLAAIRLETRVRRRMAAEALGEAAAEPADAFHLWLRLPPPWSRGAFLAALRSHEISVVPSDAFATTGDPPEAVRIGLGAPRTRDDLARALGTIAQVLAPAQAPESYV